LTKRENLKSIQNGVTPLTKKHFKAIAEILATHDADPALISAFADYFEKINPRFDSDRFIAASCGRANERSEIHEE
jgi:hypothetical protein